MSDIQKIKREERQQRREARRERALVLHRGRSPRAIDQEGNPPESGHDRHEEGVEQEASLTEEELWIEHPEALQIRAPHDRTTLSSLNPHTRIQTIVKEDL